MSGAFRIASALFGETHSPRFGVSESDGSLSPSNLTHIRIAKDQDRKGAKGHFHYRYNERRRPAKRDPLICEDLRGCAEGFGQAFGKGSGSARPKSDRPRPGNSGEREPGFTPPRVETHPFSESQPNRRQNPLAHPQGRFLFQSSQGRPDWREKFENRELKNGTSVPRLVA